jgi:archaellum component FlaC
VLWWGKKQSEVEYLRELVKDLQTQVIVLSGKHSDYLNTKIVQMTPPLNGKEEVKKEVTPEEKKQVEQAAKDIAYMLGGVST